MANTYDIGDVVRLTATFRSTGSALKDPTAVTFTYGDPAGSWTTEIYGGGNVTHPSTGAYRLDIIPDSAGVWIYRVNSTGVVTTASESYFRVLHQRESS